MIRAIKIVFPTWNPEHEIRWKYSALQMQFGDLDRLKDGLNQILSAWVNEIKSFVSCEQLLDVVDTLEKRYKDLIAKLPDIIKSDFRKHPGEVVFANQVSIAVALNVLDNSSQLDKFEMNIIIDDDEIKPGKCYGPWHVMMTNPITFVLIMIKNNTIQLNTNWMLNQFRIKQGIEWFFTW